MGIRRVSQKKKWDIFATNPFVPLCEKGTLLSLHIQGWACKNLGIMYPSNIHISETTQVVDNTLHMHWVPPFTIIVISGTFLWRHYWNVCPIDSTSTLRESPLVFNSFNILLMYFGNKILTRVLHISFVMRHTIDLDTPSKCPIVR